MLHEFGEPSELMDTPGKRRRKIADLWMQASQHDVLFSDYTEGDLSSFVDVFMDPRGVWMEVLRETDMKVIGAFYLTNVIPRFEADGHFTFWDSHASGREPLVWDTMEWVFERYELSRINGEIPPYQRGFIRFLKRLGFKHEGTKRRANIHKGEWTPLEMFGILREDIKEVRNG